MQIVKSILVLFLLIFVTNSWANNSQWFSRGENNQIKLRVDLYLSSKCPYCKKADEFFRDLEKRTPWINVHRYIINEDRAALEQFHQELQQLHLDNYSVPAVFFCNSEWIGFDKAEITGAILLQRLHYCKQQIIRTGELDASTINNLKQWAHANWLRGGLAAKLSTPLSFIPGIALIDAVSSCSIFSLLALFALLWCQQKPKTQIGLGFIFLVGLGIAHHIVQGHSDFIHDYQLQNRLRLFTVIIGGGLIAYAFMVYSKRLSTFLVIALPILVFLTAMILHIYQQRCIPNHALIFQQWLQLQKFSPIMAWTYQFIYQVIYLLPLVVLVLCYILWYKYKRLDRSQGILSYTAWYLLLIIGGFLILYPQGLSNAVLSLATLIVSLLAGWLMTKFWYKHGQIN
jgi:glutaredoxin